MPPGPPRCRCRDYLNSNGILAAKYGALVPVPVSITTANTLFNLRLRVDSRLFELKFRNYTRKQWDRDLAECDRAVLDRIPVKDSFDDRYFTDAFQQPAVINYPGEDLPFNRIVEFKRMTGQKSEQTPIAREYPTRDEEPYYPVPSKRN